MRVKAVLKGRKDNNGKQTIYIRTNIGKQRLHRATKMKTLPGQFDKEKGRCLSSHPSCQQFNTAIKKAINEAENNVAISKPGIKSDYSLFDYHKVFIASTENERSFETLRQYRAELSKISQFTSDVKLNAVSMDFLNRYKDYCFTDLGNSVNTVWKTFKFWRTLFNRAAHEERINESPFKHFKMPVYKQTKRSYLTEGEVNKIDLYSMDETKPGYLRYAAKWFVIGCYTGLRFGDMAKFNKDEHIKNGRIVLYTSKTGEIVSIKLLERIQELLLRVEYKRLSLTNQPYNRYLKDIQRDCKLKANLTGHVSRHTFGVYCAERGLSIETTAKLLGHSSIKTTAIYYKITNQRLDTEIEKLFD